MSSGVSGFRFAGIASGLKPDGGRDLALAVADEPAVAAGVFTRNLVRAAPVEVAQHRIAGGVAQAVLVNSRNANACTGEPGMRATLESCAAVAKALGIAPERILPASTGVIGVLLPAEKIVSNADRLVAALGPDNDDAFAKAMLTTDRFPKVARAEFPNGARVLGMAKGAGMIHPDMGPEPPHATMLAYLFTDAVVDQMALQTALVAAVDETFNAISVEGDTSTNDTCIAMASGASGKTVSEEELVSAMTDVCEQLARAMVTDGEGAAHVAEIRVHGLATNAEARQVARTIATSVLFKTAMSGPDANWGRILAAAGRSGVQFDPEQAWISIGGVEIVAEGVSAGDEAEVRAQKVMTADSYAVEVRLGDGPGHARFLTCDIGHPYIDVNAGYRT